jgi:hypothetical protein
MLVSKSEVQGTLGKNLGMGGRIILKWIFRSGVGLVQLAQNRNQ